jgi:predicted transcriptional regulator
MCLLEEKYDDNTIIDKIKTILNLSKKDYFKIINDSYNISINNYSYTQGLNKFNKVINYINTNN